jgi:hypothetical protein
MANILIKNWCNRDLKSKINTPQDFIDSSEELMDGCNEVKLFLEEYYIKVDDDKEKIGAKILYDHFEVMNRTSNVSNNSFKALVEKEGFGSKKLSSMSHFNMAENPRTYGDGDSEE